MNYTINVLYDELCYCNKKIESGIHFDFDKIIINIYINRRYHNLNIYISKKEDYQPQSIDLFAYLKIVVDYINEHQILCERRGKDFKEDILQLDKIKSIDIINLKIEQNDIAIIGKFKNLRNLTTHNCILHNNCNIGILKCDYRDIGSDIFSLDLFNGFEGTALYLKKSNIRCRNKNFLHLNNICTKFDDIDIDFEYFFLTTDAPKMRKLEIYRNPKLIDKELLFISGFYNLESVEIEAEISNYNQLEKLEKLREIRYVFCSDKNELEVIKKKREKIYNLLMAENASEEKLKNYLMTQRMVVQNQYQDFFHKIYVPRLERVKWEDRINNNDLVRIRKELIEIKKMTREERKKISKEAKKEFNLFDSTLGLWFDGNPENEEEVCLINSRPFQNDGIDYYVLRRKIYIEN